MIAACKVAGFDLVIVETSGIGQGDAAIVPLVDASLYVMTPEFGAASQLEKIDMLDFADFVAINKFDRKGAQDALRDVRKQFQRNREAFKAPPDEMPVYGTIAARFNDDGVTALYQAIAAKLADKGLKLEPGNAAAGRRRGNRPRRARSCRRRARAISPKSPKPCAAITSGRTTQAQHRARAAAAARDEGDARRAMPAHAASKDDDGPERSREPRRSNAGRSRGTRHLIADARREARSPARKKLLDMWPKTKAAYARRRIRREDPRQGDPHRAHHDVAVGHQGPQGRAAARTRTTARSCAGS